MSFPSLWRSIFTPHPDLKGWKTRGGRCAVELSLPGKSRQDWISWEQPVGPRPRRKLISCPTSFPAAPGFVLGRQSGAWSPASEGGPAHNTGGDGPVSRGPPQYRQEQTWMLRRTWDVKSPSGPAGSVGDAEPEQSGQLGTLGTSRPAVAVGVTDGRKCANLTFSCSLKCVFVCPDVQRRVDVRELIRHLLHMARTTSQTCESRHHAECSASCGANTNPGRPPTGR